MKDSFLMEYDLYEALKGLGQDERIEFLDSYVDYERYNIMPVFSEVKLSIIFLQAKKRIDNNKERYKNISEKKSAMGKKGGAPANNKNAEKNNDVEISDNGVTDEASQIKYIILDETGIELHDSQIIKLMNKNIGLNLFENGYAKFTLDRTKRTYRDKSDEDTTKLFITGLLWDDNYDEYMREHDSF